MNTPHALLALALAACATAAPKPDDESAAAHRRDAERDAKTAAAERARYDPNAVTTTSIADREGAGVAADFASTYNPTAGHLRKAARLDEHAREHAAAAAELERFEDAECAALSPRARGACPLVATAAIEIIPDGLRLRLADPARLDATMALMRCHLAYARARGYERVRDCPLYLRGVELRASSDGGAVEVIAKDGSVVRELQHQGAELVR